MHNGFNNIKLALFKMHNGLAKNKTLLFVGSYSDKKDRKRNLCLRI